MQRLIAQRDRAAMLAACIAVFLTALDQTVVVTALPQITIDLQIPITQLDRAAWIISGYLLGYVIAMPLMGRVSDIYGRRRVFIVCLLVFAFGSLLCGLAPILGPLFDNRQTFAADNTPSLTMLVAARFIQAAGGGAIVPVAMAVAGDLYGYQRRALALGLIGMVTEAGGVLGPLYGSVIVQSLGWQYIFYLNLPIVALLLVPIILFIPNTSQLARGKTGKQRIDLPGALLLGISLTCLSLGLAQEAAQITPVTPNGGSAPTQNNPWLLLATCIFFVAFLALEIYKGRRTKWPLIELALFKNRRFGAASLASLFIGAALIIAMADIPLFIATVLNLPPLDSGLALLRLTAMIPVGALLGGWLCGRIGCRLTALPGLLLTALSFWLMHLWPLGVNWTQITLGTLVGGLGFGLVIAPISTTALNAVSSDHGGMAAAIVTVLRMIGMILGLAALTSWGLGRFRELAGTFKLPAGMQPLTPQALDLQAHYLLNAAHEVYTAIFLAAGILCIVGLLPALFLEGRQPPTASVRSTIEEETSGRQALSEMESEASIYHGQREQ